MAEKVYVWVVEEMEYDRYGPLFVAETLEVAVKKLKAERAEGVDHWTLEDCGRRYQLPETRGVWTLTAHSERFQTHYSIEEWQVEQTALNLSDRPFDYGTTSEQQEAGSGS